MLFKEIFNVPAPGVAMELLTGGGALLLQALYLCWKKFPYRHIIAISLLTLPILYIAIESMNSFLTCDESYLVFEPVDIVNSSLDMWKLGQFRTTDLLAGVPIVLVKKMTGLTKDYLAIMVKSLHWLLAFVLILFIIELLCRRMDKIPFLVGYGMSMVVIIALPVVLQANKIINYDSLSMLFGVASVMALLRGWREKRPLMLYGSIALAAFAAQEKLIASPILWLQLVLVPLSTLKSVVDEPLRSQLHRVAVMTLKAVAVVIGVLVGSYLIVSSINTLNGSENNAFNVLLPLLIVVWPLVWSAGGNISTLIVNQDYSGGGYLILLVAAIALVIVTVNVAAAVFAVRIVLCRQKEPFFVFVENRIGLAGYLLFFTVIGVGVPGTFLPDVYLAPFHQVAPGAYIGKLFNESWVYYGANSVGTHILYGIWWAYATFVNALPTALIGLALFNAVALKRKNREGGMGWSIVFVAVLLTPLLYGIFQVPIGNRYFNMFLLLLLIKLLNDFFSIELSNRQRAVITSVVVVATLAEILPFGPSYGGFRPIWSNYSKTYQSTPSRTKLNPWWMGWGEEVYISGKQIQDTRRETSTDTGRITLYHNFLGDWMFKPRNVHLLLMDTVKLLTYGTNDYYVLNRMGLAYSTMPFPDGVKPFSEVDLRGFVIAWVFRGSDLETAGFRFE